MANSATIPTGAPPLELSVVMPCYNEALGLEATLNAWLVALRDRVGSFEILVINDGSSDGSGRILDRIRRENRELRVFHQLNVGHGRAIRRGYELSRGKFVAQVDLNGRYEISDFFRLWELRDSFSMVLGHRTHRIDSWARRGASRINRRTIQWLFKVQITDPEVPFRIMRNDVLRGILPKIPPSQDITNLALSVLFKQLGDASVAEVPIPFRFRAFGKERQGFLSAVSTTTQVMTSLINLRLRSKLSLDQ
ncbi:MAG: glycosyltransferase family 2 protein [Deltaproteobacteria bacterium]|nr:glycosyltransferase family 2 protein [Deltaproteobacteria bacterium]